MTIAAVETTNTAAATRKQQHIAQQLRNMTHVMEPGERLPSVAALAQQFGVAAGTIKVTLETLRCEGVIISRPRSGTYVAPKEVLPSRNGNGFPANQTAAASPLAGTIAVFAPASNPFYENCVSHLVREAAASHTSVECRYAAAADLTVDEALRLEGPQTIGFVAVGMGLESLAAELRQRDRRVVLIGDPNVNAVPRVPTVYADAEYAGYLATRHLTDLGHRRILYLHLSHDNETLKQRRRWRGHERALREAGLDRELNRIARFDQLTAWLQNPDETRRAFTGPDAPTGVVVWYDAVAMQLINALRQAGLSVPGDVSVMGYDNLPLGEHTYPPLDTIDLHMDVQVRHALDLLSLPAGGGRTPSATLITPTLICRASCASPPP